MLWYSNCLSSNKFDWVLFVTDYQAGIRLWFMAGSRACITTQADVVVGRRPNIASASNLLFGDGSEFRGGLRKIESVPLSSWNYSKILYYILKKNQRSSLLIRIRLIKNALIILINYKFLIIFIIIELFIMIISLHLGIKRQFYYKKSSKNSKKIMLNSVILMFSLEQSWIIKK